MLYLLAAGLRAEEMQPIIVAKQPVRMEPATHDVIWRGFILEGCEGMAITLAETERFELNITGSALQANGVAARVNVAKGARQPCPLLV
jgi:hypothetical protein